jgi:hypothetical protein
LAINIEFEKEEGDEVHPLKNMVLNYDFMTAARPADIHTIRMASTTEDPAPIFVSLIPQNAYFTVCLTPPDEAAAATEDPKTYRWCVSKLNQKEEYWLQIDPNQDGYVSRGNYKLLILATGLRQNADNASFMLLFSAGDNRYTLMENELHRDTLDSL